MSKPLNFQPQFYLRNPHIQTILAARSPQQVGAMVANEQALTLNVEADGEQVRLVGLYSPQPTETCRGVVLLLHGWLGCITSSYMKGRGEALYSHNYAVYRINFRDHGGTEALNEGFFHGCRLEEMFQVAQQLAAQTPDLPFYIVGFSMGGNFALRLAWLNRTRPIENLRQVVAVCPSVNPGDATAVVDNHPIYGRYFRRRWLKQLQAKEAAFPHLYQFSPYWNIKTCMAITDLFIADYSHFPDSTAYFNAYGIQADQIATLQVPTTILAAADDPVIPIADIEPFAGINPHVAVHIMPQGGHVGFVESIPVRSWLDEVIPSLLNNLS